MTNLLFDAPYNKDERDVFTPRLKHFYLVYPDALQSAVEQMETYEQLAETLPQWAVQHGYTRETIFGANQPVFTEDYAVVYFTMVDGFRTAVTTPLSTFSYADITYDMVSA